MCKCSPSVKTPWCGKPGCEMPEQWEIREQQGLEALAGMDDQSLVDAWRRAFEICARMLKHPEKDADIERERRRLNLAEESLRLRQRVWELEEENGRLRAAAPPAITPKDGPPMEDLELVRESYRSAPCLCDHPRGSHMRVIPFMCLEDGCSCPDFFFRQSGESLHPQAKVWLEKEAEARDDIYRQQNEHYARVRTARQAMEGQNP